MRRSGIVMAIFALGLCVCGESKTDSDTGTSPSLEDSPDDGSLGGDSSDDDSLGDGPSDDDSQGDDDSSDDDSQGDDDSSDDDSQGGGPSEGDSVVDLQVQVVVDGLDSPWGLDFLPDGRALVTEKVGRLRLLAADHTLSEPLEGVPNIRESGQGGLLDVVVGPSYAQDTYVYFCYAGTDGRQSGTEVARARFDGEKLDTWEIIFVSTRASSGIHYGCRLAFHADGHLFVGLGERSRAEEAQSLENYLGTIVRMNPDGGVPDDNPFVGEAGIEPLIWSYGHRNIQGMAVHPGTGEIWNHEHGPRGGDEVNIPRRSKNYGWPRACYGSHYNGTSIPDDHAGQGFVEPVHYWTPSIAPSGMMFYQGDMFPGWQGDLFVGALAGEHVARLRLDGEQVIQEEKMLESMGIRVRELSEAPDGSIYVLSDNGKIYRLYNKNHEN